MVAVSAPGRATPLAVRAFQCWMTVYRRIWRSSIWSSLLGPLFYLGAMGLGLGTLVNKHGTASLGGVSYLAFVAPAILASGAMNAAMSEASYPVFGSVKWNRIYIAAQASPLRPGDIFRGHLMFMTMRIAMNAALVTVYMWAFGATRSAWTVLAWPAATLTGLAFAAPYFFAVPEHLAWELRGGFAIGVLGLGWLPLIQFRVLADTPERSFRVEGRDRPLRAGMGGRAEVVVGRRSLISYAFEPLRQLRENLAEPPGS